MARKKGLPKLELAPDGLEGKKALEPEIVRWVSRNVDIPHPDPIECPDPFAWTLLRQCRDDPEFLKSFTEKLWAKLIPARSQLEGGADAAIDGKPTLDLIERILGFRDKAIEDTEAAAKVASPKVPSAFEAFNPMEKKNE